ncbi:MAG: 3-methyl-2-oxobutanoate hydroxymethyltransferase [Armatimonadota bacterium]
MNGINKIYAPYITAKKLTGQKITMLTAYDYSAAKILDNAGIDAILVGDSLGMAVYGDENTLSVSMEDIIRHTKAVSRGAKRSLIVSDMPFMSYQVSPEEAAYNAARLIKEGGAEAVKLEGGREFSQAVSRITKCQIPVMGHLGLTPQSVYKFGGYKMQGKSKDDADRITEDALLLETLGVFAIVLECIPAELARKITEKLTIPAIGIGSGPYCDGQVQVINDILGLTENLPRHGKRYLDLNYEITKAVNDYKNDVLSDRLFKKEGVSVNS